MQYYYMKKYFSGLFLSFFAFLMFGISGCNSSGSITEEPVSFDAFVDQFPQLALPYSYTEDSLLSTAADSLRIKQPGRINFVPDSVFFPDGDTTAAIYAVGRGKSDEAQRQWLFFKRVSPEAKQVYVLIYDNKDSLLDTKKVAVKLENAKSTILTFKWTRNRLLNLYEKNDLGNGYVSYKRKVFSLLGGDKLQLIMTNNHGANGSR